MSEPFLRRKFLYGSALLGVAGVLPARGQSEPAQKRPRFNVLTYGAVGDGKGLNTRPLQAAIDACAAAGGGTVYFPAGNYLTGTLVMKSHVGLHLDAGATILGSPDLKDYPSHVPAFKSHSAPYTDKYLIYGERVENIFIEGHGTLDGQGNANAFNPEMAFGRPYIIRFSECRNVTVRDIRLINSPMWVQHYLACTDLILDGVRVHSHVNRNNDGIDIECCDRVRISNCDIDSGDDGICLKSSGMRITRNVTITNCVVRSTCNGLKAGTETNGGFENIAISNCAVHDTRLAGLALESVDGATLSGVAVSNIAMRGVGAPVFIRLGNRARPIESGGPRQPVGKVENITISDIEALGGGIIGCSITGLAGHRVRNVELSNIRLRFQGGGTRDLVTRLVPEKAAAYPEFSMFGKLPAYGFYCRHVEGLKFSNLHTDFEQPEARPALVADDVERLEISRADLAQASGGGPTMLFQNVGGATIHGCRPWQEIGTFLRVEGQASKGIVLLANDLRQAQKPFEVSSGVPAGAVLNQ